MSVINRVRSHFAGLERHEIEVPEWGDENGPLKIFYSEPTIAQDNEIHALQKESDVSWCAKAIVLLARTAEGLPLFKPDDFKALTTEASNSVVLRVGVEMYKTATDTGDKKELGNGSSGTPG